MTRGSEERSRKERKERKKGKKERKKNKVRKKEMRIKGQGRNNQTRSGIIKRCRKINRWGIKGKVKLKGQGK
ncbi:hypothetical protein HYE39_03930 [Mycoplasmopsis bovis]|nr:hypothetical protein [Mycoplasmopsis bovis]QQH21194.1 hypothetical protein HYE39_03930 [Mycoplasmopsis bovis]